MGVAPHGELDPRTPQKTLIETNSNSTKGKGQGGPAQLRAQPNFKLPPLVEVPSSVNAVT